MLYPWPIEVEMFHGTVHTINVENWYKHRIRNIHMVWSAFVSRRYGTAGYCTLGYPSETRLKLESCEISFAHIATLTNRFGILYRKWQYNCHALCELSKLLCKWNGYFGRPNFTKFEFEKSFVRIPYTVTASQFLVALYDLFTHIYQGYFICDSRKFAPVPVK